MKSPTLTAMQHVETFDVSRRRTDKPPGKPPLWADSRTAAPSRIRTMAAHAHKPAFSFSLHVVESQAKRFLPVGVRIRKRDGATLPDLRPQVIYTVAAHLLASDKSDLATAPTFTMSTLSDRVKDSRTGNRVTIAQAVSEIRRIAGDTAAAFTLEKFSELATLRADKRAKREAAKSA